MNGTNDHPNAVNFKYRLRKLLLGKDVHLLSKKTSTENEDNLDCSLNASLIEEENEKPSYTERDLAIELFMTSNIFKDMDIDDTQDDDCDWFEEDIMINKENNLASVIEDESLRYIGGYIVRKFQFKYPQLGHKVSERISDNTWIDQLDRGGLYAPSEHFLSQLVMMRGAFIAFHGSSLQEGKDCMGKTVTDMKKVVSDVSHDVIQFFVKISVYFRIRKLNKQIMEGRKITKESRSKKRKYMKLTT